MLLGMNRVEARAYLSPESSHAGEVAKDWRNEHLTDGSTGFRLRRQGARYAGMQMIGRCEDTQICGFLSSFSTCLLYVDFFYRL